MRTESLKELIALCRAGQCSVTLEANQSGIVARVSSSRGGVILQTAVYLDANDEEISEKLETAVRRIQ